MVNADIPVDGPTIFPNPIALLPRPHPDGLSRLAMWIGARLVRWGRANSSRRALARSEWSLRRQNAR